MIDTTHYDKEIAYLRKAGKYFASRYPRRAAALGLDSAESTDPHIERLIESFAFLAARIHQRLDDDFPELCGTLLSLIAPSLCCPVPALTMIEIEPVSGVMMGRTEIPQGAVVESEAVEESSPSCIFRTTAPVVAYPIKVSEVTVGHWVGKGPYLRVSLAVFDGIDSQSVDWSGLRFWITGDIPTRAGLYEVFHDQVDRVAIRIDPEDEGAALYLDPERFWGPTPFQSDNSIFPQPEHVFTAFRILQEYFLFQDRYRFFDLSGLEPLRGLPPFTELHVDFELRSRPAAGIHPTQENVRLFCVPAVNLFHTDGVPVSTDLSATEYRLEADLGSPASYEIYSVDSVATLDLATGQEKSFPPFLGFLPRTGSSGSDTMPGFHVVRRPGPEGKIDCWLQFVSSDGITELPPPDVLSIGITCTHGDTPGKLAVGDLCVLGEGFPESVTVRNIMRPTQPLAAPILRETGLRSWQLLGHVTSNMLSLLNEQVLAGTLELFASHAGLDLSPSFGRGGDVRSSQSWRRKMQSIVEVRTETKEQVDRGSAIRGTRVTIVVSDEAAFEERGELLQFMDVMAQFFKHYASINSFVELALEVRKPPYPPRIWPWKRGVRPLL